MPYHIDALPEFSHDGQHIWTARVPLLYFFAVEWHYPDRVCRQFGGYQEIPASVESDHQLHKYDGRQKSEQWDIFHYEFVQIWEQRNERVTTIARHAPLGPFVSPLYDHWFYCYGRRLIGNPDHHQSEGYLQTAPSYIAMVEALRHISIVGDIAEEHGESNDFTHVMKNIARDELVRLRYGYVLEFPRNDQEFMYEAIPQVRAPDRWRDVNRRGQPAQGGRRRRHIPDINIAADVNIEEEFDHNADSNVDNNDFGGTNSMGDVTQLHLSQPVGQLVPYEPGSSSQDPLHTPFNLFEPGSSSQDHLHTPFNLFGPGSSSEVPQHDGRPIRYPSHVMHNAPFSHEIHQWYNEGNPSGTQTSQVDNPTQNNTTINFQYQRRYPGRNRRRPPCGT
nr:serine/threonine-protein phosphatase 7 long form homolog [Ipomoea batatas]